MKQLIKRLQTRSFDRIFFRLFSIAKRYGLTRARYISYLEQFLEVTGKYHATPTFPVTAVVLDRHRHTVQKIQDLGAEFAVHGYRHIDYSMLGVDQFQLHLEKAKEIFTQSNITCDGFRFPYLKRTAEHITALEKSGFKWDSSEVISWDIAGDFSFERVKWENYQKILETYQVKSSMQVSSLPQTWGRLVEIPVSVPDDDILIERLEITKNEILFTVWYQMFQNIYEKGELFTLQLHPERFIEFHGAVEDLISYMARKNDVWFGSLGEIAEWWQKRESFRFRVESVSQGTFNVSVDNCAASDVFWHGNVLDTVQKKTENSWLVTAACKPVIGVASDVTAALIELLQTEGFAYEYSTEPNFYALYLTADMCTDIGRRTDLLNLIEEKQAVVPQFHRWPKQSACAVAFTGDIDCITVFDFLNRING